jgi:hypothetical protein
MPEFTLPQVPGRGITKRGIRANHRDKSLPTFLSALRAADDFLVQTDSFQILIAKQWAQIVGMLPSMTYSLPVIEEASYKPEVIDFQME